MNSLKTGALMVALTMLFVFIGELLGGKQGMIAAFVLAGVMNALSYWFSDRIVLAMYRAQPADEASAPGLCQMVARLAERAAIPMPRVYIIPQEQPNAFATGRSPRHAAVAVTEGLLQIMEGAELEGVIAHELAHVRNRDILIGAVVATMAGAIMMLSRMAQFGAIFGGGRDSEGERGSGLTALFVAIFAGLAAVLIQMAISRSREYQADAAGAAISGRPRGLARALAALQNTAARVPMEAAPATSHMFIVNPFRAGGLVGLFSTHPPVEERIARLEQIARAAGDLREY
jgi:heat shock protein HtpX